LRNPARSLTANVIGARVADPRRSIPPDPAIRKCGKHAKARREYSADRRYSHEPDTPYVLAFVTTAKRARARRHVVDRIRMPCRSDAARESNYRTRARDLCVYALELEDWRAHWISEKRHEADVVKAVSFPGYVCMYGVGELEILTEGGKHRCGANPHLLLSVTENDQLLRFLRFLSHSTRHDPSV
jgi:hypothetical protein